ncbi:hypothetical protein [Pseudoalteromonas sp. SWN166]|uniref:hypothetical protein n=1 Tax=Pseudoalteromonas sp. SWN166 TaxID=2792061 RepID=UPI0018CDF925|nr:hypothetical protein [Pseudoalteromonas sp. SWN166]MBH0038983.1 hypothetical protein [Pseudoalteromonas sp. SWN166]
MASRVTDEIVNTRFLTGGALTPVLAAKLRKIFNIGGQLLFNLEAQANVQKARELWLVNA